jgi:hypothetical protein
MRHPFRLMINILVLSLAVMVSSQGDSPPRAVMGGASGHVPPPNAAARILPGDGACIRFISVFVPARGGDYVVGISFSYRDLNRDGQYTPGVDKLDVCVNCADACDWGP